MITRGEGGWREGEMDKGHQLHGEGWKLEFGGKHDVQYIQMWDNIVHLKLS